MPHSVTPSQHTTDSRSDEAAIVFVPVIMVVAVVILLVIIILSVTLVVLFKRRNLQNIRKRNADLKLSTTEKGPSSCVD